MEAPVRDVSLVTFQATGVVRSVAAGAQLNTSTVTLSTGNMSVSARSQETLNTPTRSPSGMMVVMVGALGALLFGTTVMLGVDLGLSSWYLLRAEMTKDTGMPVERQKMAWDPIAWWTVHAMGRGVGCEV
jgi:hypothetical protein